MEAHKLKTQIQGSWKSFFELFKKALDSKNLALRKCQGGLMLNIQYPFMTDSSISGQIKLL